MQVVLRFDSSDSRRMLAARLGASKVLALLSLDDHSLDDATDRGTFLGVELDDVERMSPTELRRLVKKQREEQGEEKARFERIIANKERQLDKYARIRTEKPPERVAAEEALGKIDQSLGAVMSSMRTIGEVWEQVLKAYADAGHRKPDADVLERLRRNGAFIGDLLKQIEPLFG
jgi:hypothetical protein